jgi:hypothetical protein
MGSAKEYRVIAQDCLRMAAGAEDERDRPLWVTMAQSWIQLAEHVSRLNLAPDLEQATGDNDNADDIVKIDDNGDGNSGDDDAGWSRTN